MNSCKAVKRLTIASKCTKIDMLLILCDRDFISFEKYGS